MAEGNGPIAPSRRRSPGPIARGGWGVVQIPQVGGLSKTIEFGHDVLHKSGYVRNYGADFIDRVRDAGFTAESRNLSTEFTERELRRFGVTDEIYYFVT